ncbi:MAG: J domain-containing protein [Acidobacteriaceae bacterium]
MIGQAYEDRGFWETVINSSIAPEPNQTGQAWPLAEEIQQLMGADAQPDPLFFEESWTLGATTAAENLRRRRRQQTEGVVFGEFDNLGAQAYVQQRAWWTDDFAATKNDAVAADANAEWPLWRSDEPAASGEDDSQEWEPFLAVEDCQWTAGETMSMHLACRLLGVAADSTLAEIKTAYRRKAGQWHPDRLQHSSEDVRRRANEQMIAINQAYGLLRERWMQQAA